MKKIFRKNQLVITALALMIAVAGYFSYMNNNMDDGKLQTAAEAANAEVSAGELEEDYDISDEDVLQNTFFLPSRMLSSSQASAFELASRWPVRPGVLL